MPEDSTSYPTQSCGIHPQITYHIGKGDWLHHHTHPFQPNKWLWRLLFLVQSFFTQSHWVCEEEAQPSWPVLSFSLHTIALRIAIFTFTVMFLLPNGCLPARWESGITVAATSRICSNWSVKHKSRKDIKLERWANILCDPVHRVIQISLIRIKKSPFSWFTQLFKVHLHFMDRW